MSLIQIPKYIPQHGHDIVNTACINVKVYLIIEQLDKYCKNRINTRQKNENFFFNLGNEIIFCFCDFCTAPNVDFYQLLFYFIFVLNIKLQHSAEAAREKVSEDVPSI